jgi:outer membrane protein assembly factor BamA
MVRSGAARFLVPILPALVALTPDTARPMHPGPPAAEAVLSADQEVLCYGSVVDSVYVTGTRSTRPFAVLREMETEPGELLEAPILQRDRDFLLGLGVFSRVEMQCHDVGGGRVALEVRVRERPAIFQQAVLPVVNWDMERDRLSYGARWTSKNFRGRFENLNLYYERSSESEGGDFSWGSSWLGMRHIGVGVRVFYFRRLETPGSLAIRRNYGTETFLELPLNRSKMEQLRLRTSLFEEIRETDSARELQDGDRNTLFGFSTGLVFDSRNSGIRPTHGVRLELALRPRFVREEEFRRFTTYTLGARTFTSLHPRLVLAVQSRLDLQRGLVPEYNRFGIGGAGTVRGLERSALWGTNRYVGSTEMRYDLLEPRVLSLPGLLWFGPSTVDVGLGLVLFADMGAAWSDQLTRRHWKSGYGVGLRLFSPLQNVIRLDYGFTPRGETAFYLDSGVRF